VAIHFMHYNFVRIPLIDVEAFAKLLGDAREARSMTLQRFAKEVGVSTAAVGCWEKNRRAATPGKMKKIASVLKVTEAFSRTGTDTMEPEFGRPQRRLFRTDYIRHRAIASEDCVSFGMLASQVRISVEFLSG